MESGYDDAQEDIEESQEEGAENENEYEIWKKNAPYLYDVLVTWGLDWPSLCVNWLPKIDYLKNSPVYSQKLILGTYTGGKEEDFLMIANIRLPYSKLVLESPSTDNNLTKDDKDYILKMSNDQMIKEYSKIENKIEIETKIHHEGEVNKAKASPLKNNLIATQTNKGEIHIFDYLKYPKEPIEGKTQEPTKRLKYHNKIGYALSWSTFKENYLLSGSYDGSVCLWDLNSSNSEPLLKYHEHKSECEDVCFSRKKENIFGTCGDDKTIKIYDYRTSALCISIEGHNAEINNIDFNPDNEYIYITGSNDKLINLWDIRQPKLRLHSFIHHKNSVLNVKWNSKRSNIFASSGEDNKLLIWDLTQIGANIARDDNEEAPSEMIFEHGGHLDKINDIDWNQNEDMMCASADNSNNLHIWQMNIKSILNKELN